jgi:Zn-dependent protease
MKKPIFLSKDDPIWDVARLYNVPLVIRQDVSALPLSQVVSIAIFHRQLSKRFPTLNQGQKLIWSFSCTFALLGSEWGHNLAHALTSILINKPVDAIRIHFGMPLLIYFEPSDPEVTPKQHMLRAIGGPVFNLMTLPPLYMLYRSMKPDTPSCYLARLAFDTNAFLALVSLSPLPPLDGGPLFKWALVHKGKSNNDAEKVVRYTNGLAAILFSVMAWFYRIRAKNLLAIIFGLLGMTSLAIALGWLDEAY